jgi:hypothetical protein
VALYYYEHLTLKEIGRALGISESRVSQVPHPRDVAAASAAPALDAGGGLELMNDLLRTTSELPDAAMARAAVPARGPAAQLATPETSPAPRCCGP